MGFQLRPLPILLRLVLKHFCITRQYHSTQYQVLRQVLSPMVHDMITRHQHALPFWEFAVLLLSKRATRERPPDPQQGTRSFSCPAGPRRAASGRVGPRRARGGPVSAHAGRPPAGQEAHEVGS